MKPTLFLRIASVLTFIHAVLHTIGGVFGKPGPGAAGVAFATMQTNQFLVFGLQRTYADFYRGMGISMTISMTVEAFLFWQLGSLAKAYAARLRPIIAAFAVAYLAIAVNSWCFFFQAPVVAEILIALCLILAIVTAKSATTT
ncbi:MAG: hypothetical protein ABR991_05345 [Terracidiphilus sp.]